MKTYTALTTPTKVILEALPHKYPMELNKSSMIAIMEAMKFYIENAVGIQDTMQAQIYDEVQSLRSGILETIGIEEI